MRGAFLNVRRKCGRVNPGLGAMGASFERERERYLVIESLVRGRGGGGRPWSRRFRVHPASAPRLLSATPSHE